MLSSRGAGLQPDGLLESELEVESFDNDQRLDLDDDEPKVDGVDPLLSHLLFRAIADTRKFVVIGFEFHCCVIDCCVIDGCFIHDCFIHLTAQVLLWFEVCETDALIHGSNTDGLELEEGKPAYPLFKTIGYCK